MGGSLTTSPKKHKMFLWSQEAAVGSSLKGLKVTQPHPYRLSPGEKLNRLILWSAWAALINVIERLIGWSVNLIWHIDYIFVHTSLPFWPKKNKYTMEPCLHAKVHMQEENMQNTPDFIVNLECRTTFSCFDWTCSIDLEHMELKQSVTVTTSGQPLTFDRCCIKKQQDCSHAH